MIYLIAGLIITRRAPRTDPIRAALIVWGGWLTITAAVFSFMNGIVHPYYTVALAPAVAACIAIGATLLWRNRSDVRAATTLSGVVLVTTILAAVLLSRHGEWQPWLRAAAAVGGVGAAVLLLVVGRLARPIARVVAVVAVVSCLLSPAAYSIATAATPHSGAIPSVGPSRHGMGGGFRRTRRAPRLAEPRSGSDGHAVRRRRRLHLGGGGCWLEQCCRVPIGQRRTGYGDRWLQRH